MRPICLRYAPISSYHTRFKFQFSELFGGTETIGLAADAVCGHIVIAVALQIPHLAALCLAGIAGPLTGSEMLRPLTQQLAAAGDDGLCVSIKLLIGHFLQFFHGYASFFDTFIIGQPHPKRKPKRGHFSQLYVPKE